MFNRKIIDAKLLRDKVNLCGIPNDKPGYYKWWAKEEDVIVLFKKLDFEFLKYKDYLEKIDNWYCIYVGVAIKESIRARINWHINDKHNESAVRSGYLSTFRKSISSVIAKNQYDKETTNDFIDKLKVEYFEVDLTIKSNEATTEIEKREKELINKYLRLLNIKGNHHKKASDIKKKLISLRKEAKK